MHPSYLATVLWPSIDWFHSNDGYNEIKTILFRSYVHSTTILLLRRSYVDTVQSYIENGYAREVPVESIPGDVVWYLPHHAVKHPRKGKVHVVFDCAAKTKGLLLNDVLLQGPGLANSLVGVLPRFQMEPVALVSDVASIFHQIRRITMRCIFFGGPVGTWTQNPPITRCSFICSVQLHLRASKLLSTPSGRRLRRSLRCRNDGNCASEYLLWWPITFRCYRRRSSKVWCRNFVLCLNKVDSS